MSMYKGIVEFNWSKLEISDDKGTLYWKLHWNGDYPAAVKKFLSDHG